MCPLYCLSSEDSNLLNFTDFVFQETFTSLPHWLLTIFVMTLGELNYSDNFMPWEQFAFSSLINVLFVIFVLAMPIILMNMLVSLLLLLLFFFFFFFCLVENHTETDSN